jgi:DNA polymerase-3 subunit delta'
MAFSRMTAFEYLRRADQQNRLAHAYLITGPPGSGKELLAADLASLVNGTPAKNVFSAKARDIFVARPESKSRRIVIAQIRDLEHARQMRASDGRRKVRLFPMPTGFKPRRRMRFSRHWKNHRRTRCCFC